MPRQHTDYYHFFSFYKYITKRLFEINERGTYQDPSTLTPDKCTHQDEKIFQTACLINCGWFMHSESCLAFRLYSSIADKICIIKSFYYLSAILGLVREGSTWTLNPFDVSVYAIARISWLNYFRKFVRVITQSLIVAGVTLLVAKCVWQHLLF